MKRAALALVVAGVVVATALGSPAPAPLPVPNAAFPSAPDPNAPAVVWAVGDGGDGSDRARAVADLIARDRPDRVLYLGDVYESGSAEDFRERFDTVYGGLARITAPTPGNHEWPAHREGYDPYWRARTGAPTPPWYAFRIGGWRVLSLNSEAPLGPGSKQQAWLRRELRRRKGTCTLAFWHRPLMSAGDDGGQRDVAPLWRAVRRHARLVVNAHDHNLQRFRRRDGVTQYVSGAGGRALHTLTRRDGRLVFGDDARHGALRMELRPGRARLTFVAAGGQVLDRSAVRCARR